ncbi:MAG: hypothetical protein JNK02_04735 [Planctomycetes bacterium]|nr:hypothetical protein [Planctomycetota bacterium]
MERSSRQLSRRRAARDRRGGFALIAVLLVLLSLLVLATPLLLSARGADQASTRMADRTEARIALDTASRHARAVLAGTYPSADIDRTPYWDDLEEVRVANRFPDGFLDANDPGGSMWTVEARDTAGLVDLDSASPQVLANLMGLTSRLGAVVGPDAREIPLAPNANFGAQGFLWVGGELVQVRRYQDGSAVEFTRGVLGPGAGQDWRGGPRPASSHGIGAPVLDQRALAPVLWRLVSPDDEPRAFESIERLRECAGFALAAATDPAGAGVMDGAPLAALRDFGSAHGGVRAGPRWQRAARLVAQVEGGRDGRLRVDSARWMNPGATVRVRDGSSSELALVASVAGAGEVVLDRVLTHDYLPYEAVVDVLARRPVNLNTAPRAVLEALFLNLQVAGQNSRVTADEAAELAALVIESRPFEGFRDFLERVVLPAAGIAQLPGDAPLVPDRLRSGEAFLDPWDAVAVYANGLNANDGTLAWSTMPYAFTSRDVHALELRAAHNAPSGVLRYARVREEVVAVAPQRELVHLWARQEDFEEELRLSREAAWWLTGPEATTQWDAGAVPPSRLWPQLGTFQGRTFLPGVSDASEFQNLESPPTPERTFPSRAEQAWAALMPTRLAETQRLRGRVDHFDHETRDPEGRYLPDQLVEHESDSQRVRWSAADAPFLRSHALSLWIRPRGAAAGRFLDVGGSSPDVDRSLLEVDGDDLVLRVIDGFGDHRETSFRERGELRYSISGSPGLPADVWHHVELDVRGNRPSQMHLLVNGLAHGVRTPGLTRLSAALSQGSAALAVESIEGFPERCVVRIGNELIEVSVAGGGLSATRSETGPAAGFGGRMARERAARLEEDAGSPPAGLAGLSVDHAAGTPVELYGYSLPLLSDVPAGEARLARAIGKFRVARVAGVTGGQQTQGDPITIGLLGFQAGTGLAGANSSVNGLRLACADDGFATGSPRPPEEYMTAFHPDGGYALLVQVGWDFQGGEGQDTAGSPLGGLEVIRYSGWSNNVLQIAERGVGAAQLPNLGNLTQAQQGLLGGSRSFITTWDPNLQTADGVAVAARYEWSTFVVPISFATPGVSDVRGFLVARKGASRFAQVTRVADAEFTEWIRYDYVDTARGQLVRDDPDALLAVHRTLTLNRQLDARPPQPGGGGGGGPGGGGFGAPSSALLAPPEPAVLPEPVPAAVAARPSALQTYSSTQWDPRVGENENAAVDFPLSRAVETWFQFRGVFGTFSHDHPAGTPILPVFEVDARDVFGGRPGRLDAVFLVGADPSHPGWPLVIHRAHTPALEHATRSWRQPQDVTLKPVPVVPRDEHIEYDGYLSGRTYVAFQARSPENVVAGSATGGPTLDTRLLARIVLFPSGERPRAVSRVRIGGGADGSGAVVPSAVVDEIAFGDAQFGRNVPAESREAMNGASLVLDADLDEAGRALTIRPKTMRAAIGNTGWIDDVLPQLAPNGGLLRIGDEILAYRSYDASSGRVQLAADGRGLLGTKPGAHELEDPVLWLEHRVATVLTAGAGPADAQLTLANVEGFPPEGLVLVGSELIHYTRIRGSALEMPRASSNPGALDGRGEGLFRGRFGTTPAAHAAGDAVILFPVRYPDRWARRADAPELAYFGFEIGQPSAFWNSIWFQKQDADAARIGALVRTDPAAPWDADPDADARLRLLWQGDVDGQAHPLGRQADRLSARVFVEYQPGAFDLATGAPHGWRQTPRLTSLAAFYLAPHVTLRSVER